MQDLQESLSLSSKNSSQPPSSDYKKDGSPSLPKKQGAKKGHKGTCRSLYPQEEVDHFVSCTSTTCPHCGSKKITEKGASPTIHQRVEVERGGVVVTQYEKVRYICCECSRRFSGELPQGVTSSAFGVKLSSIITLLTGKYHLSKRETKSAVKDLYEVEISLGTIVGIENKMSQSLESLYGEICQDVRESDETTYVDETGWRESGQRRYVWVASTVRSCSYMVAKHRNRETYYRFLGDDVLKPIVSDRYSVYNCITHEHQYCLAHIFRDFERVSERKSIDGVIGSRSCRKDSR
ncbi:MAG: transposase [Sulfurovum sp.]|nr:transposase [Sulfurovum sp.]NNJ45952.1 transposase [Sulfurovum sp.]